MSETVGTWENTARKLPTKVRYRRVTSIMRGDSGWPCVEEEEIGVEEGDALEELADGDGGVSILLALLSIMMMLA